MNIVQDIEDELDAIADASASMVYHEIKNFHLLGKARAEIIRLRTAVALIGECADEFKLENERLREALRDCHHVLHKLMAIVPGNDAAVDEMAKVMKKARAALGEGKE